MPVISKIDETGAVVGEHDLRETLLESELNLGLVHEVVRSELAAHRQGTAAAKSRGQVSGGGAKPWRQKGTGRARAGTSRVPQWTKGGVAFPPIPRSYEFKVNKKARAKAFRMVLGDLVAGGTVKVLSGVEFDEPSTKRGAGLVDGAGVALPLLVIAAPKPTALEGTADPERNLLLSLRNLPGVRAVPLGEVEVQDYAWAAGALITEDAIRFLEGSGA
jgi:large subunit ribosomal protein L4